MDDLLRRRRLGPCRNLKGWPLKPGRTGGIKNRLGLRSYPPEDILYSTMRSPLRRRLRKECKPSRRSRSSYSSRPKHFTSLVANRWICSKQWASTTRFGEQACMANSKWGRTNVLYSGANADTDISANNRLIMNSIRLCFEDAYLQWMDGQKQLYMRKPSSLTTFGTCMELPGRPVAKDNWSGGDRPIAM